MEWNREGVGVKGSRNIGGKAILGHLYIFF